MSPLSSVEVLVGQENALFYDFGDLGPIKGFKGMVVFSLILCKLKILYMLEYVKLKEKLEQIACSREL